MIRMKKASLLLVLALSSSFALAQPAAPEGAPETIHGEAFSTVVAAVAVPFLLSLDDYIPRIEKEASARLKEPVTIRKIRLIAFPLPHVVIDGITVGKSEDLKVGKVTVTPALLSFFSPTKVISSIEIDGLVLTQKAIDKIPLWSKQDGPASQPPAVRIGSVRLDDALVRLDAANFGPFDARILLDDSGAPAEASLTTRDGKLKALVKPEKSAYLITASAKGWKVPVGPPVVFDELDVEGIATLADATFSRITGKLYGGTASGKASIAWQKGMQVKGDFDLQQVELKNLVPILSPGTKVSGRLSAKPVFTAAAKDAGGLMNALRLTTPFDVQNGVVYGVDIQKAAMTLGKQGTSDGETRFDQLSGHLALEQSTYKFTQLKIVSGALGADGNLGISPRKELSGRVTAQVRALGTSAGVALNVSGTVQSPTVMPTGGTIAGAALGTVVLPGIGTGVGAKAGQMIEGLFGRK